jgi:hypothetical protein
MDIPKCLDPYKCINCQGKGTLELEADCVNCGGKGFIFEDIWEVIDGLAVSAHAVEKVYKEVILPALKDTQFKRDMGALIVELNDWLIVAGVARQKLRPDREESENRFKD